ncbi:MAG: anaerobic ribonucleoside-triphosphate reductase activating protein [Clostridia bacterium]|nr:anaerobic ribonucleoside-triphosphate reductase activating protein [Clostridia bacterium]
MATMLRIAGVVKESIVDGPGFRYVIFTQGCPHHCKGCHNPQTHDYNGGKLIDIDFFLNEIKRDPILKGITLSGGEPFEQTKVLSELVSKLDKKLTVMAYTGYTYEYLVNNSNEENGYMELLSKIDVLIDGRFEERLKDPFLDFRGSSNQRAIECKNSLKEGKIILHNF